MPLLSIVIANYNYGRYLEDAIRSVLDQADERVELIICDAASSDNSVEIIKKYVNGLPPNTHVDEWISQSSDHQDIAMSNQVITWWCSEKDGGQSAAFNKGFSHARGKYLTWLNADDVLVPGCLEKVFKAITRNPDCQWFTGNAFRFLEDGSVLEIMWGPRYYPRFLQRRNSPIVVFGPTSFFSREIYERVGRIDEQLHYAMDNDLWMRFMYEGIKQRRINCLIWAFRMHEASKTAEFGEHTMDVTADTRMKEEGKISVKKVNYSMSHFLHFLIRTWRLLDGSLAHKIYLSLFFRKFIINQERNMK